ncbi:hypothetical protein K435DRAFT_877720 [Dendrothele bispora CBS 962.96]|uniref:Uncharacterized protein n=1 Tax=Dendrothele bispora (strain CBS 962.96) TaxID=1314807 RepID=A0A4S8KPD3_DENBC|nr:hypothetical protein K435DRAFT_877720 [Dendrothele bispora CBS 962.96]
MPAPRKRRNSDLAYEASGSVSKELKTVRAQERRRSTRGTQKTVPEPELYDDPEPDLFTHPPTSSAPSSPVFEDDEPLPPPPFPVPFNVPTTPIASGSHQITPSTPIQTHLRLPCLFLNQAQQNKSPDRESKGLIGIHEVTWK